MLARPSRGPHLTHAQGAATVPVTDPYGVATDRAMPTLALATDPADVQREIGVGLPRLAGADGFVHLRAIRIRRHKPGRRCLIEYDVDVDRAGAPTETVTVLGKVRAGRDGRAGHRLLDALWRAGFCADSPDGVSVPEPIGMLPRFRMWLQRKVPGEVAASLLTRPDGATLGGRIAEAARKLHLANVPTDSRHTMVDELRILHEGLPFVVQADSRWAARVDRLLDACDRLGAATPEPEPRGIHRDFYPDQVIVDGQRLYLIDIDQYCQGDPGLDIGNFLGHVTEQSLRTMGDPGALAEVERALEERFVELSGEATRPAVQAYAALTLARHIYLSTHFPERRPFTGRLLDLCEERLGVRTGAYL